jgi:hypothetical protein
VQQDTNKSNDVGSQESRIVNRKNDGQYLAALEIEESNYNRYNQREEN